MSNVKRVITKVYSHTDWSKTYDIYEDNSEVLHCSCPSSIYQDRECKHLTEFYSSPEYDAWLSEEEEIDAVSPIKFRFDSRGYISVTSTSDCETDQYITPTEATVLANELESIIPFLRLYADNA